MSDYNGTYDFRDGDSLQFDAREIAPLLGLTLERLLGDRHAGNIYHIAEEAEQEWSTRKTFLFVIMSSILCWSAILFFIYLVAG